MKALFASPDGEYKAEGNFSTIDEAWDYVSYIGSRWFFYPIPIVTGDKCGRIIDVPSGIDRMWIGKSIKKLMKRLNENQEDVMDFLNGRCPLHLLP